jgi:hypothetical protein
MEPAAGEGIPTDRLAPAWPSAAFAPLRLSDIYALWLTRTAARWVMMVRLSSFVQA